MRHCLLVSGLSLVIAAGVGSTSGRAASPGANGVIAFQSDRAAGNPDIWTIAPDGSSATRLTTDPGEDWAPAYSPDGSRIAFTRSWSGVWVMNADGSGQTRLGDGAYPTWSPDGSRIAYADGGLWVMDADGTDARRLTSEADSQPAWSPDGRTLAVTRGGFEVYLVAADGTSATRLAGGYQPDWSPDGSRVVMASSHGIRVADVSSGDVTQLTTNGYDEDPAFSPDGSQVVFMSGGRADNYELFLMNPDGSSVVRLTTEFPAYDAQPTWQPLAAPRAPEISIADTAIAEGDTGTRTASFRVELSAASDAAVTVAYATADGTASAPADYTAVAGSLTFAPGELQKSVEVPVVGDTFDEADESFTAALTDATNATVADASATGQIIDDDAFGTGRTLVGSVSTLTTFAPGGGSLGDRAALAGARVRLHDEPTPRGASAAKATAVAATTSDADGRFLLADLPRCGARGCELELASGAGVLGRLPLSLGGPASVTEVEALVADAPGRVYLGGSVELLGAGGGDPVVEVHVYRAETGTSRAGGGPLASSAAGTAGDWRLALDPGKDLPARVRVVLHADGSPVDEEVVALAGLQTHVPALQALRPPA